MSNRRIYVVRGSEDGNIGAFTSAKRAAECAHNYVSQAPWVEEPHTVEVNGDPVSIADVARLARKANGFVFLRRSGCFVEADIEIFLD